LSGVRVWRQRRGSDPTGVGTELHEQATSMALLHTPRDELGDLLRKQVESQILPSWCRVTLDRKHGGFRFSDAAESGKQLVSQSRMLWNLAHAHRLGFRAPSHDLLARASDGYEFLQRHLRDPNHGGYFWSVTRSGQIRNSMKTLYGQAFVIFALVEFSRATRDPVPLDEALSLWRTVMEHLHDPSNGGWIEHALPDWSPLRSGRPVPIEIADCKSANAHLHWMEALIQLFAATGDPAVATSLAEAVDLLTTHFYTSDPRGARGLCTPDWRVPSSSNEPISLGHNVEFAWMLIEAEQVLARPISVDRLVAYVDHALATGFDDARGGLDQYVEDAVRDERPRERIWWVQAELVAALSEAAVRTAEDRYETALRQHLAFVFEYQVDPRDGLWWEAVDTSGTITNSSKHHQWKAGYHELRAIIRLIDAL
jgi:mannobiose 2-epimerase